MDSIQWTFKGSFVPHFLFVKLLCSDSNSQKFVEASVKFYQEKCKHFHDCHSLDVTTKNPKKSKLNNCQQTIQPGEPLKMLDCHHQIIRNWWCRAMRESNKSACARGNSLGKFMWFKISYDFTIVDIYEASIRDEFWNANLQNAAISYKLSRIQLSFFI